jgi:hypothetical protein
MLNLHVSAMRTSAMGTFCRTKNEPKYDELLSTQPQAEMKSLETAFTMGHLPDIQCMFRLGLLHAS